MEAVRNNLFKTNHLSEFVKTKDFFEEEELLKR